MKPTVTLDMQTLESGLLWMAIALSEYDDRNTPPENRVSSDKEDQVPDENILRFAVSIIHAANAIAAATLTGLVYNGEQVDEMLNAIVQRFVEDGEHLTDEGHAALHNLYHFLRRPLRFSSDVFEEPSMPVRSELFMKDFFGKDIANN